MSDNWQPIETAPKDGTKINLGKKRDSGKIVASQSLYCWFEDGFWWAKYARLRHKSLFNHGPTHWMPLSDAPEDV